MAIVITAALLLGTGLTDAFCQSAPAPASRPTEKSVSDRVAGRTFPSVFQAWNPADNLKNEKPLVTAARHDLLFHGPEFFGLKWNQSPVGLSEGFTPASIEKALARRSELLRLNPNMVLLAEIRYRDAHKTFLPEGHKWWMTREGKILPGWEEGGYLRLDYENPEYRAHVAAQCKAAVGTGAVDGVMLDWWTDDNAHLELIRAIRDAVGDKALILVNANDRAIPRTGSYVNGLFMECYRSKTAEEWKQIAESLDWAEKNLRQPRINCLETWYHNSRQDLNLTRATTTLSLTHSDGYCLFSDPNPLPTPDHLHDWYTFWDKTLGRPLSAGKLRADGASQREFDNGLVIYNPMGNKPITVRFNQPHTSLATGKAAQEHQVDPADGDIFLRPRR